MKISLSTDYLLLQVYARAALDATVRDAYQTMLSPDRRSALQMLLGGVAAELSVELLSVLTATNVDRLKFEEDSDTLIEFDLRDGVVGHPEVLRLLLEQAIVSRLLGEIYGFAESDSAAAFADTYRQLLGRIGSVISRPLSDLSIRPFPY